MRLVLTSLFNRSVNVELGSERFSCISSAVFISVQFAFSTFDRKFRIIP